uniref:Protein SDA1 n=1 Tax=Heterorhabditis bacteriophora TaxID=37862 RepID=A0A1I7WYT8_HETBA
MVTSVTPLPASARYSRYTMSERNLGLMSEIIRKDPESYHEEFREQFDHYLHTMKLLHLQPQQHRMELQPLLDTVTFLSGLAKYYPCSNALLKRLYTKKKDMKLLGKIQNFCFAKMKDSRAIVARAAQLICIDAFRKRYWRDAKCANVTAMKFFLGSKKDEEGLSDDSDEQGSELEEDSKTIKEVNFYLYFLQVFVVA